MWVQDERHLCKKELKLGVGFVMYFLLKALFGVVFDQGKMAFNTTMHDDDLT